MRANQTFNIDLNLEDGDATCVCRVLFWWEEREAEITALIKDERTLLHYVDGSVHARGLVNLFLESVTSEGKTKEKLDLGTKEWADVLHHAAIPVLFEAYIERTRRGLSEFQAKAQAYFDPDKRGEGDFLAPPEAIEFSILTKIGVITLADIRAMSWAEMMKFDVMSKLYSGSRRAAPGGIGGMPLSSLSDPGRGIMEMTPGLSTPLGAGPSGSVPETTS
jgi:hypothetical protein